MKNIEREYMDEDRQITSIALPIFKRYKEENYTEMFPDYIRENSCLIDSRFRDIIESLEEHASGKFEDDIEDSLVYRTNVLFGLELFGNSLTPEIARLIYPIVKEFSDTHIGGSYSLSHEMYDSILRVITDALYRYGNGEEKDDLINVGLHLLGTHLISMWN